MLTPTIEVQADMAVYLNQQMPKPGGGTWALNDPLPAVEKEQTPAAAIGEVAIVLDGDEFTLDASVTGLKPASEITDPRASAATGTRVTGDYYDIWMLSDVPNVVTIQMGLLEDDGTGTFRYHFDSRVDVDHEGRKMTVNNINSIEVGWPNEPLSLYDVRLIAMDVENAGGPEEPSGQHRLNDRSPFSRPIDWTKPDP